MLSQVVPLGKRLAGRIHTFQGKAPEEGVKMVRHSKAGYAERHSQGGLYQLPFPAGSQEEIRREQETIPDLLDCRSDHFATEPVKDALQPF